MSDLTREQIERAVTFLKAVPQGKTVYLASGVSLEELNALDWFTAYGRDLCDMALRSLSARGAERDAVLEEAATEIERGWFPPVGDRLNQHISSFAARIRSLKRKPPT